MYEPEQLSSHTLNGVGPINGECSPPHLTSILGHHKAHMTP